ncbi:MAG: Flagellar hook-associated protein 1 [Pelotomaculum sp. PtaU1.Bin035]|nr:MAG: Flagellar hook-associated protein 1 [Pelotomaculum sp. PtaU1.Bin035]
MYSTFFGLETARRGLAAARTGMDVSGHNVANANTTGYTRQRADQVASDPYTMPSMGKPVMALQLGTGVTVEQIERIRDNFLDGQIRVETNKLSNWKAQSDALSEVETVFMEPSDNGLNTLLANFWSNWQELSKNAESTPVRTTVMENAVSLANGFNHTYSQLETVKGDLNQLMQIDISDINSKARQIANLNTQIINIKVAGDQPNDLLDKRDLLLDELAKLTNYSITDLGNGSISIDIGTVNLVDGITQAVTPLTTPPNWTDVTDGALNGINQALTKLQSYEDDLNTLAANLIKMVNNAHTGGIDLNGNTGEIFFGSNATTPSTNASNIAVNPDIQSNVSLIAAATTGTTGVGNQNPGDGSNALKIAGLQNTSIDGTNGVAPNGLGGSTFDSYYKNMIARLGVESQESSRMVDNQQALVDQLSNRKESISGVSMDEEMTNLIQYQYAYQGAARVVTTLDSMLDTLINRMAV